jgi:hypothetical protein
MTGLCAAHSEGFAVDLCSCKHSSCAVALAELLLQQQVLDGNGAELLAAHSQDMQSMYIDPADVRMAMLRGWAAETAAAVGQHASLVSSEREVAAVAPGLGELLVGFALQQRQQQ